MTTADATFMGHAVQGVLDAHADRARTSMRSQVA
jgi:hypothetical protein